MRESSAQKQVANWTQVRLFRPHRISTTNDVSEMGLLSFIKASLDEFEGTHHCWLNRSDKNDQLVGADGIFVVLASKSFDCGIVFEKLKIIQKRFPHIIIMGLKTTHSSADQMPLLKLLMTENITFPILLSQQTFPLIKKGACYILFKNFRSPVIYHEKDAGLEVLCKAVQELQVQPSSDSKSLNVLRCVSWKQDGLTKDQYIFSPVQNLLLYYPGCVSADERASCLFFSDCNHHRIIVSDGNGEILDCGELP